MNPELLKLLEHVVLSHLTLPEWGLPRLPAIPEVLILHHADDLVFDENGQITAVVIGVGGFLGIGEKAVAADFDALEFTLAADNTERWVLPTSAEGLTAAPEFVWAEDEPVDGDDAMAPAADPAVAPAQ